MPNTIIVFALCALVVVEGIAGRVIVTLRLKAGL
jgi:hypothetical protein